MRQIFDDIRRIFLVDDDREYLFEISESLRKHGFAVQKENNPLVALKKIIKWNPDVVILDMDMPGLSGLELLQSLRKSSFGENVPVILLTGNGSQDILETGFRRGLDGYLTKPVALSELILRLNALLNRVQNKNTFFPTTEPTIKFDLHDSRIEGLLLWIPGHHSLSKSNLKQYRPTLDNLIAKLSHRIRDTLTNFNAPICKVQWIAKDIILFKVKMDMQSINQKELIKNLFVFKRLWKNSLPNEFKRYMILKGKTALEKNKVPDFFIKLFCLFSFEGIEKLQSDLELVFSFEEFGNDLSLIEI